MALDLSGVGQTTEPMWMEYTWKDVVLYALGIGMRRNALPYLYEGLGPRVFPSFATLPKLQPMFQVITRLGGRLETMVHGSEAVTLHRPFPPHGRLQTVAHLQGVYDLKRFAIAALEMVTKDDTGLLLATSQTTLVFRDEGGFGGGLPPKDKERIKIPRETPSLFRVEERVPEEQALLYRLSGDENPLHADPEFAMRAGFSQGPILHGLCSLGYMVRHTAQELCQGDAGRVQSFGASFRKPVWPGETLITEGWPVSPGCFALQVLAKERNEVVLGDAWIRIPDAPLA